jgi:hypothetical protein
VATTQLHLTGIPPATEREDVVWAGDLLDTKTAREIVELAHRRPWSGDKTVVRITAAHRVSDQVWNVLLKTLEEPPPHLHVHLYAASTDALPSTICSRAHVKREHLPDPTPEDASRLIRLYESGDALAMLRAADRQTDVVDTRRALEGLWHSGVHTGRLDQATQAEHHLYLLNRGVTPRLVVKSLLITLAIHHRQALAESQSV